MRISEYVFGELTVDGHRYTSDVIITPDKVIDSWWRKEGHRLQIDDLDDIVKAEPELLIIGTGYYGRMDIADETLRYLEDRGIEIRPSLTGDAVFEYNEMEETRRTVAALHLTC